MIRKAKSLLSPIVINC